MNSIEVRYRQLSSILNIIGELVDNALTMDADEYRAEKRQADQNLLNAKNRLIEEGATDEDIRRFIDHWQAARIAAM